MKEQAARAGEMANHSTDPEREIYLSDIPLVEKEVLDRLSVPAERFVTDAPPTPLPPTSKFVYVLTFFATLGGFLMGYDIGIISGAMLYTRPQLRLSVVWTEAIVSAAVGTAAVSSITGGWIMDALGRRPSLLIASVVFSVGGVVMAVAPAKEILLVGRMVCGLGIGLASVVVPVYVAEMSPVRMRGRLTMMWQVMINLGILVSSLVAGLFSLTDQHGWRYMLGLSAVPGVMQFLGFLFMPESPRWLVDKGHVDLALRVLVRMRGHSDVISELEDIKKSVEESREVQMKGCQKLQRILTTRPVRKALVVGVGILVFQQWCGINTAIYYSGTVLKMAGFPVGSAVWLVVLPNALLFLAGLGGIYVVDRVGRRPLLLYSMIGTIIGLIIIAVGFQLTHAFAPALDPSLEENFVNGTSLDMCQTSYRTCNDCVKDDDCGFCLKHGDASGSCLQAANGDRSLHGRCNDSDVAGLEAVFSHGYCPSHGYSWLPVLGVAIFVLLFAPGMAPMPWTINAEIYPLWARGTCQSLAAASAWISNLIISFTFLSLVDAITTPGVFWMFTGLSLLGLLFFLLLVPETKGTSLEEVELLFMDPSEAAAWKARRDATHTDSVADDKTNRGNHQGQ